jgi:hypothetical protein
MNEKIINTILSLLIILGLFGVGFYLGRKTIKTDTKIVTEYIKGDTIRDTLFYPQPIKIIEPIDTLNIIKQCIKDGIYSELWPEKVITEYIEVTKQDTTKIMNDWATKRLYSETLFQNDSIGSCVVNAEVQYNRMKLIGYNYTPITKQVTETIYKTKLFSPFVGGGYLINPWEEKRNPIITLNGGVFIKEKYGLQIQYMRTLNSKNDYIGGNVLIKF